MMDWNNTTLDLNLRTSDWNVTTTDWNFLTMLQNVRTVDGNGKTLGRGFIEMLNSLSAAFARKPLKIRIRKVLQILQFIYYPILAIAAVPANIVTIVILSQEKCGLSRCVSHYLVDMATADLLVIIFDLILRHIPFVYLEQHHFLEDIPVSEIHQQKLSAKGMQQVKLEFSRVYPSMEQLPGALQKWPPPPLSSNPTCKTVNSGM
ncbi:uncharacterized protein LOC132210831 [Stegostoma tigrinum]|uniref:uncharacterized protein LOC132210831 n=1 Tax=Stegostoma tigrinum TaxID=3053191 RepID=UPI0028700DF5|nr:uncharacterized protein LOC132210831 [Stegostoma tigrinum]